jgi:hypothetical protein
MAMFGAGAARPADNHTAIIEFRVGDVDGEYRRLKMVYSTHRWMDAIIFRLVGLPQRVALGTPTYVR